MHDHTLREEFRHDTRGYKPNLGILELGDDRKVRVDERLLQRQGDSIRRLVDAENLTQTKPTQQERSGSEIVGQKMELTRHLTGFPTLNFLSGFFSLISEKCFGQTTPLTVSESVTNKPISVRLFTVPYKTQILAPAPTPTTKRQNAKTNLDDIPNS